MQVVEMAWMVLINDLSNWSVLFGQYHYSTVIGEIIRGKYSHSPLPQSPAGEEARCIMKMLKVLYFLKVQKSLDMGCLGFHITGTQWPLAGNQKDCLNFFRVSLNTCYSCLLMITWQSNICHNRHKLGSGFFRQTILRALWGWRRHISCSVPFLEWIWITKAFLVLLGLLRGRSISLYFGDFIPDLWAHSDIYSNTESYIINCNRGPLFTDFDEWKKIGILMVVTIINGGFFHINPWELYPFSGCSWGTYYPTF